jgi:hypothetical protein
MRGLARPLSLTNPRKNPIQSAPTPKSIRPASARPHTAPVHFTALFTRHRIARLHRWAMLWLLWFAGFLEAAAVFAPLSKQVDAIAHEWLDRVERRIFTIVLARAAPYLTPIARHTHGRRRGRGAILRALMGSRLRRQWRAKDVCARIAGLAEDINVTVARHCRRVARGLTRLAPIRAKSEHGVREPTPAPPVACAAASDTS